LFSVFLFLCFSRLAVVRKGSFGDVKMSFDADTIGIRWFFNQFRFFRVLLYLAVIFGAFTIAPSPIDYIPMASRTTSLSSVARLRTAGHPLSLRLPIHRHPLVRIE
jgi:hypothetical protein